MITVTFMLIPLGDFPCLISEEVLYTHVCFTQFRCLRVVIWEWLVSVIWNERGLQKTRTLPCSKKKKICHEEPCNFDQIVSLHLFYYQLEDCYKVWWGFFMLDYCSRPLNSLQRLQLTNSFFQAAFAELVT